MTTRIGIALFPDVEELDWVGPWEVLRTWQTWWPDEGAEVFTVAATTDVVTCANGVRVLPDHAISSAPPMDVLVYPGGTGSWAQLADDDVLAWLRRLAAGGTLMTSVCTGALVFAAAGLLDGRPATTHWSSVEELRGLGRDVDVRPDERWVDSGDVVTGSGVSAGIDMALHLVRRLAGEERAKEVRRFIQYDPAPPV